MRACLPQTQLGAYTLIPRPGSCPLETTRYARPSLRPSTHIPHFCVPGRQLQTPVSLLSRSPSPVIDPGLPPGVFSSDVRQRGLDRLPDGSLVQTIRLQNNTILSRTIPPPAPPLPAGIDPDEVTNRTFVRDTSGGWAQNITLVNGTLVEQEVVAITAPPQPSTLTNEMIRARTYTVCMSNRLMCQYSNPTYACIS